MRLHEGRLVVAMSDPTDVYTLDDLRVACGLSIVPVVTTEERLRRMLARVFSTGEQVAGLLQEAADDRPEDVGDLDLGVETPTPRMRPWSSW
ncbi:MAG TPA: hypothetical protein VK869_16110 [Rubrobacteraceae bacterium]|nr:hypothetical protein [Rubrobacteraceae bacterium]